MFHLRGQEHQIFHLRGLGLLTLHQSQFQEEPMELEVLMVE
jgi:hypothetical protein